MPWSWSNIDWPATLRIGSFAILTAVAVPLLASTRLREAVRRQITNPPGGGSFQAVLLSYVSLCLLAWVGTSEKDDWLGADTAAWVQAIGSVAAILAAVIIDQGAARRLRRDREEQEASAREARLRAVERCGQELAELSKAIVMMRLTDNSGRKLGDDDFRPLRSAREVLEVYRRSNWEANASVVLALSSAARIVDDVLQKIERTGMIFARQQGEICEVLDMAAADVRGLFFEAEGLSTLEIIARRGVDAGPA